MKSRINFLLILILLFAFLVRAYYYHSHRERLDSLVIADMRTYNLLARNLIEKGIYGFKEGPWPWRSYRPPLYPFFLSLIYRLAGFNYPIARIVQAVLASFSCLIIFLIAKELCPLPVALLGAFLFTVDFSLVHMAGLFLSENIYIPLSLILIWLLIRGFKNLKVATFIGAGFVGGLAALCRPIALPFMLLAGLVPLILKLGRRGIVRWLLMLVTAVITISPWTIRNYRIHHRFVPISTNGGEMLWMGLHHGAPGGYHFPEENNPLLSVKDEVERDRLGYREAVKFILEYPGEFLKLTGKKFGQFWECYLFTKSGKQWLLFMAMGGAGFLLSWQNWRKWLVIYVYMFSFMGIHLLVHSSPRYRWSIHPYVELWAALFLVWFWDKIKEIFFDRINPPSPRLRRAGRMDRKGKNVSP